MKKASAYSFYNEDKMPPYTPIYTQSCFTSTDTVQTIRGGEPRMATSTFTQLLVLELPWALLTIPIIFSFHAGTPNTWDETAFSIPFLFKKATTSTGTQNHISLPCCNRTLPVEVTFASLQHMGC